MCAAPCPSPAAAAAAAGGKHQKQHAKMFCV